MRFLADGPDLPDDLLIARDDGNVLFFCGSGVSRANAGLPGFLDLAKDVLKNLRVLPDSPAQELVKLAEELQTRSIRGVSGILAADRIFGLLEREFDVSDIEYAVGQALKTQDNVNLEAHRILLNLSRTQEGKVQIVTTNFDLLFEKASTKLSSISYSQIPDIRSHDLFDGIVHLHGMFDSKNTKSVNGNLILSSAEFGRAYLSEGWATDFIRAAMKRYFIVFVGYSADDPPVQYLLEALNRSPEIQPGRLFSFHSGDENEATVLWQHKGVNAIAYSPENHHAALWQTLKAWSERARNPERWRNRLLRQALRGPERMKPHERGQVAHLATTKEGAHSLAMAKNPIPASWICVFDRTIRYGIPGKSNFIDVEAPEVDPFLRYCIDSDPEPSKPTEKSSLDKRKVPGDVMDIFIPQPKDGNAEFTVGLCGHGSNNFSPLPPRLISLAIWFGHVCSQPTALWWAAGQEGLHPIVLSEINLALLNRLKTFSPISIKSWRYLLESWPRPHPQQERLNLAELSTRIEKEGWTPSIHRAFSSLIKTRLSITRPYGASPHTRRNKLKINHVLNISLEYLGGLENFNIPNEELHSIIPILRKSLEEAVDLEKEIHSFWTPQIPPFEPDLNLPSKSFAIKIGLNLYVFAFSELFKKLLEKNKNNAIEEFEAWRRNNDPVFERLRIWASGIPNFLNGIQAGEVLTKISNNIFWDLSAKRDLLLVMARRWNDFTPQHRKILERRLRNGLPRRRHFDLNLFPIGRAESILSRLSWLKLQGCIFSFDIDAEISAAREIFPDWDESNASHSADSNEAVGGFVHTDTTHSEFGDIPINELIVKALEAQKFLHRFLQRHDPYVGLCIKRPVRILAALMLERDPNDMVVIGWSDFLQNNNREDVSPRLATLIARRLFQLPENILSNILLPITHWIKGTAKRIFDTDSDVVRILFDRLLNLIRSDPNKTLRKERINNTSRDWVNDTLNSAVGNLVGVLFIDPILADVDLNSSLPEPWSNRASALLALPGDHSRFALLGLASNLCWINLKDPVWPKEKILSRADTDANDREAVLEGFLFGGYIPDESLFERLKPFLVKIATTESQIRQRYFQAIGRIFINSWRSKNQSGKRYLSDIELTNVIVKSNDDIRINILWHVGHDNWVIEEKLTLFKDVWPRQLVARNSKLSNILCGIAIDDVEHFPLLLEAIMPFLTTFLGFNLLFRLGAYEESEVTKKYPEKVLSLLWKVLPKRSSIGWYGIDNVLECLNQAMPALAQDFRFIELKRRI